MRASAIKTFLSPCRALALPLLLPVLSCGPGPDTGTLEGVVLLASTQEPAAQADIRLGNARERTDDEGIFYLEGVDPGSHILSVSRQDLGTATRTVEIRPGESTAIIVRLGEGSRSAANRRPPGEGEPTASSPPRASVPGDSASSRGRRGAEEPPVDSSDERELGTRDDDLPSSPGARVEFEDLPRVCASQETTFVCLSSQPGDYIGGGRDLLFTSSDAEINWSRNHAGGITVIVRGDDHWSLSFAPPEREKLVPGRYTGAHRFPFHGATRPGLSVSGAGKGCNELTGRFEVLFVDYTASGEISAFAADFEQHCGGRGPSLLGRIFLNVETSEGGHVTALTDA